MSAVALPQTTTERLLAIADRLEAHPEEWRQCLWVDREDWNDSPILAAGAGFCGTPGCIAGTGVMLTPRELIPDEMGWPEAGAVALGLSSDLATAIFAAGYEPDDLPGVLRVIASLPEGGRTVRAFLDAIASSNLRGANLRWAYLSEANLSEADLRRANLSEANLSEADLRGANLSDANLRRANLSEANLSDANLSEANLYRANLRGADLSEANLRGADLRGARADASTCLPDGWTVTNGRVTREAQS